MSRRTERVNQLIRAEICSLLLRDVKDPRVCGLITITEVSTSPDFRSAKVFFSIMGNDEDKEKAVKGLAAATGFMRRELAQRLKLRHIPELTFCLDESIEHGYHVLELMKQISTCEQPDHDQKGGS